MAEPVTSEKRLPLGLCVGWGMGGFGTILLGDSFGTLLLRYMTDQLGILAVTAAMLIAASKLYDAVVDPLIGAFGDRVSSRIGRRRPFLMVGVVTSPLAFLVMFIAPPLSSSQLVAYAAGMLVVYSTSYALWDVAHVAMPAEMTRSLTERTRLFAYKNYAASLGQLCFIVAGPWLLGALGRSRYGYAWMAMALAILALIGNLICVVLTARAPFVRETERRPFSLGNAYVRPLKHKPFLLLIGAKGAMFVGISAQSGMFAYFVQQVLVANDAWLGYLLLIMSAASLLSIPLWMRLGRRIEKKHGAILGVLLMAVASMSWITAGPGEPVVWLVLRTAVKSAGMTGFLIFIYSMFSDVMEDEALTTGDRQEGAMSGLFATSEKICAALGLSSVGVALHLGGYLSHPATGAHQSAGAVQAIQVVYAFANAAFGAVSIALLLAYPLTAKAIARKRYGVAVA